MYFIFTQLHYQGIRHTQTQKRVFACSNLPDQFRAFEQVVSYYSRVRGTTCSAMMEITEIICSLGKQEEYIGHDKSATNSGNTSVYNCNFI